MVHEEIEEKARKFHEDLGPSHDFGHVLRVRNLAQEIGKKEGADTQVLNYAATLHDIGRYKEFKGQIECHAEWGSEKAREIMRDSGMEKSFIDKVCSCIKTHRYSSGENPASIEAKVLSDADNLDALGAVGVARVFSYGGEENVSFRGEESSLEHFRDKILNLEERMFTETGKKLAEERTAFVKNFLERFEKECKGLK